MVVCVCHRVSDKDIAQACKQGASSLTCLEKQLKLGTGCGKCRVFATDCLRKTMTDTK